MNLELKEVLENYPIIFEENIQSIQRSLDKMNNFFNENINTEFINFVPKYNTPGYLGYVFEKIYLEEMNKIGKLKYESGHHMYLPDLYCEEFPFWSIEVKIAKTGNTWYNSVSKNLENSTKYQNPNRPCLYTLVKYKIEEYGNCSAKLTLDEAYFGMLAKNDWVDKNGDICDHLINEVRDEFFIKIY